MAGMVVKNNMSAINTLNTLNKNHSALAKSLQKVSSGMRINSAADDASGYAISERMRVQIRSLDQDNRNTQNGNSMMKVAEGAVSSTVEILKTLKEKVINAANDTNTDSDRQQIQKELDQSIDQINDNANVTYNGKYLVDGSHNRKVNASGNDATPQGTKTHMTNESMLKDTTWSSKLVDLKTRSGDALNIHTGDTVTVSIVAEGKTFTTSFTVSTADGKVTTMQTLLDKAKIAKCGSDTLNKATDQGGLGIQLDAVTTAADGAKGWEIGSGPSATTVSTADLGSALTFKSNTAGLAGQISGFTI